ncbi:MAG: hypothetical protein IH994_04620 [Proteobacteria bacterium]|nr:hypothetical protein [Pseudomonadota bacterium]
MRNLTLAIASFLLAACQTTQTTIDDTCSTCTHTNAYNTAKVFGNNPTRGIVLHVHGCSGLYIDNGGWQTDWLNFLTNNGFVVVAPDSFADIRPPKDCPEGLYRPHDRKSLIYALRIRQAEYAVRQIREKFPGHKVIVWGHSEGGVSAPMLNANIDGVISTGAPCPDEWLEGIAETPLLMIQGTADPYLQGYKKHPLYGSLEGRCKLLLTQPKWEWLTVDGMGHAAELWQKNVKLRISKFLGIPYSE